MPWIEGIGDEVTITVSIFLGICLLLAAWISTGIRDIPLFSVIIVQLTRRQRTQEPNSTVAETPPDTSVHSEHDTSEERDGGSIDPLITVTDTVDQVPLIPELSEDSDELDESNYDLESLVENKGADSVQTESKSSDLKKEPSEEQVVELEPNSNSQSVPVVEDLKPSELRHRRLQFFSGNTKTCSDESQNIQPSENASFHGTETEVQSDNGYTETGIESINATSHSLENVPTSENAGNEDDTEQLADNVESLPDAESRDSSGEIRVRIKFLNDTQRLVTTPPNETIGNFRRRHFEEELSQSNLVRFIFNGQDLRNDSSTLQSYNICDNSVLHCLVTQQQEERETHNADENNLDIGFFMFPLFGLLLGIIWYMRIMYRQFFNVTSTLTLGGITFLFVAALMSSLRGQRAHEHAE